MCQHKILVLISGPHASGKSTIAAAVAERLGLRYVSAGEIFRRKAAEHGMDVVEFTKYVERHPEVDYEIDNTMLEEMRKGNAVVDSQLAYFFAKKISDPRTIKISILIYASFEERVRRLMRREGISKDEAERQIRTRERSEKERFRRLYGVEIWSIDDFDAIVNTTNLSKEDAISVCLAIIRKLIEARGGRHHKV